MAFPERARWRGSVKMGAASLHPREHAAGPKCASDQMPAPQAEVLWTRRRASPTLILWHPAIGAPRRTQRVSPPTRKLTSSQVPPACASCPWFSKLGVLEARVSGADLKSWGVLDVGFKFSLFKSSTVFEFPPECEPLGVRFGAPLWPCLSSFLF